MKYSIKIAMASFLVLSSSQLKATEVDINVTDILSQSVSEYLEQASREFEKSLKESVYINTKGIFGDLLREPALKNSRVTINSSVEEKTANKLIED